MISLHVRLETDRHKNVLRVIGRSPLRRPFFCLRFASHLAFLCVGHLFSFIRER